MAFTPVSATLKQAKDAHEAKKFVYYHPCSCCNKACSTPTLPIWQKRVQEYGSVENVYSQYKCRDCRKGDKAPKDTKATKAPVVETRVKVSVQREDEQPVEGSSRTRIELSSKPERPEMPPVSKYTRIPGAVIHAPDDSIGVSVWENGDFRGTTWTKLNTKK